MATRPCAATAAMLLLVEETGFLAKSFAQSDDGLGETGNATAELHKIKCIYLAIIFATGLVGGLLPLFFHRFRGVVWLLPYAHGFSGGVFLATALCHLFPDTIKAQAEVLGLYGLDGDRYPIAGIGIMVGFFVVLLFEKVLIQGHAHEIVFPKEKNEGSEQSKHGAFRIVLYISDRTFKLRNALLMLAMLSVHSVMAGIALGMMGSKTQARDMFIAIVSHKGVAALALGIQLYRYGATAWENACIIIFFASVTPIGIGIGIALENTGAWTSFVFEVLSTGAFLYVGTNEVTGELFESDISVDSIAEDSGRDIHDEEHNHSDRKIVHTSVSRLERILRYTFVIIGGALIAGLQFVANDPD